MNLVATILQPLRSAEVSPFERERSAADALKGEAFPKRRAHKSRRNRLFFAVRHIHLVHAPQRASPDPKARPPLPARRRSDTPDARDTSRDSVVRPRPPTLAEPPTR